MSRRVTGLVRLSPALTTRQSNRTPVDPRPPAPKVPPMLGRESRIVGSSTQQQTTANTATLTASGRLVVDLLLGEKLSLTSTASAVFAQPSRQDPDHLFHWATSCVAVPLLGAMEGRVRWSDEARQAARTTFGAVASESHCSGLQVLQQAAHSIDWQQPLVAGLHYNATKWHEDLFGLLRHDDLLTVSEPSMLKELLTDVLARCEEQYQRCSTLASCNTTAVVPPVWCRRLRKMCIEQLPVGSSIVFGDFFMKLVGLEARYMPTPLVVLACDDELMYFHASLPGRRESGLAASGGGEADALERHWQVTESYFRFAVQHTMTKSIQAANNSASMSSGLKKVLEVACNAASFIANDDRDGLRVLAIVRTAIELFATAVPPADPRRAQLARFILQAADVGVEALLKKASIVRWASVDGVAGVLRFRAHMASALLTPMKQRPMTERLSAVLAECRHPKEFIQTVTETDTIGMLYVLDMLTNTVVPAIAQRLRTPHRFDEVVQRIVHATLADCASVEQLARMSPATAEALRTAAPPTSATHSIASAAAMLPKWSCGCGRQMPQTQRLCLSCSAASSLCGYRCQTCKTFTTVVGPAQPQSTICCGQLHPADTTAQTVMPTQEPLWVCSTCQTWSRAAKCGTCRAVNPWSTEPSWLSVDFDHLDQVERRLLAAHTGAAGHST